MGTAPPRATWVALAVGAVVCVAGCGGGAPLMHPAHVLPADEVSMGAGAFRLLFLRSLGSMRSIPKSISPASASMSRSNPVAGPLACFLWSSSSSGLRYL